MINIISFIFFYVLFMLLVPIVFLLIGIFQKKNYSQYINKIILFNILDIQVNFIKKEKKINGFILSNHRSWLDFSYDNYFMNSTPLGRTLAFWGMAFWGLLKYKENRTIAFNRKGANRKKIYQLCKNHLNSNSNFNQRILFYPEGTRMKYSVLESANDLKSKLKIGLLKEIYDNKEYPVQILISSNKEKAFNEKKFHFARGVKINSAMSQGIHPKDYGTFEEFMDKISEEWYQLWRMTHL